MFRSLTGAIDSIYAEAGRRLRGFIAVLVTLLRALPVLHADETTDRVGTANCWMHVVSIGLCTLIHASVTRGGQAIDEAGVLRGYRGVIIHDRLAMYWKLRAEHGLCGAHLLRDLADVALVATQAAWAAGLAHRRSILRYMYDLDVAFTNNQGKRDLRPTKLHRKISGCFRSHAGAERLARLAATSPPPARTTTPPSTPSCAFSLAIRGCHPNRPEHLQADRAVTPR